MCQQLLTDKLVVVVVGEVVFVVSTQEVLSQTRDKWAVELQCTGFNEKLGTPC